jgi:hypothetical protein
MMPVLFEGYVYFAYLSFSNELRLSSVYTSVSVVAREDVQRPRSPERCVRTEKASTLKPNYGTGRNLRRGYVGQCGKPSKLLKSRIGYSA